MVPSEDDRILLK